MVTELLAEVRDRGLSQAGFERAVERLTGHAPSAAVRAALLRLFAAFDGTNVGSVDAASFVSGFLMLAGGSKSDKLAMAFRLFDEDRDGFLTRRELYQFLRSFLVVLVTLSDRYEDMPQVARHGFVDAGAVEATATIYLQSTRESEDRVNFTEFGLWYNNGGFVLMPWLELLDHAKWPDVDADAGAAEDAAPSGAGGDSAGPVFVFQLDDEGETVLEITEQDVDELMRLVAISRISEIHADDMVQVFAEEAGSSGTLSKTGFDRAIRKLVPGSSLDDDQKSYLSFALSNLFYAFDRDHSDAVDFDEFAAGFALLASGSKSDKLALAFRMFDEDDDGYISRREMWRYVRAYLTMLASLNEGTRALSYADVSAIVDGAAVDLTRRVFSEADLNKDNLISYEEFGQWYNDGGFEVIPWLELLDVSKWNAARETAQATGAATEGDGAEGPEPELVFEFPLGESGASFAISATDVQYLKRVVAASRLAEKELPALHAEFTREAKDGVLDKDAFDRAVRRLIPGSSLSGEDQQFLSFALSNIFFAFDRDGNNVVDFSEFLAGFSLLVQGSKSDKLALAFRMFDEDDDGFISRLEMWKYLRAFLTVLMSVNSLSQRVDITEMQSVVDKAAVDLTKAVFTSADLSRDGAISYEEFGQWYNAGGFDVIPWLELLDLKKWPSEDDVVADEAAGAPADVGSADDGSATDGAGEAVFEFQLSSDGGDALQITATDVENLQRLNDKARFNTMTPEQLYRAFADEASDGTLDKPAFDRVVRKLVPGSVLTKDDKAYLSFALSNIFYAFDRDGNGAVDFNEFASGFSILAGGSKSDKLSLAFHLFDLDRDGYVSRRELWEYLRAFLTVLVALNGNMTTVPSEDLVRLIDRNALELTGSVFEQADVNEDSRISYEEFGQWYNAGGFQVIPWLELLDLRKWPASEEAAAADAEAEGEDDVEDDEDDEDDGGEEDGGEDGAGSDDDIVFQFVLGDDGSPLLISSRDVSTLRRVVGVSGLDELDLEELHSRFSDAAKDGVLDKAAFDGVVRSLIPGARLTKEDKAFLSFALSNIFFAFDRDGNNVVDFDEFAAGFSLLSSGSKSDKLSLAFRLFDEDGDGFVSRREMWKYLRAFLTVLVSLKELSGVASVTELQTLIDKAAMDLTGTIMSQADLNKDGRISYEEFGQWYNSGGFEVIPWLELLDLGKWPSVDEPESSSAGGDDAESDTDEGEDGKGDEESDVDGDGLDDESDSGGSSLAPVFEFQLTDSGDLLAITEADCQNMAALNEKAGIIGMTADELVSAFRREVKDGFLEKRGFDATVRALVPGSDLSNKDKSFLSFCLSNIFFSHDRDGENKVDFKEFAAGFTILAGGSKSDKLSLAFRLFDEDGDGCATRREMWQFLRAFLTTLMAINMLSTAEDDTAVLAICDTACGQLITKLWDDSRKSRANEDKISYEEFGLWYNNGGFNVLPWLELLDLRKWAVPSAEA